MVNKGRHHDSPQHHHHDLASSANGKKEVGQKTKSDKRLGLLAMLLNTAGFAISIIMMAGAAVKAGACGIVNFLKLMRSTKRVRYVVMITLLSFLVTGQILLRSIETSSILQTSSASKKAFGNLQVVSNPHLPPSPPPPPATTAIAAR
mmetsp:Transcript_30211/g.42181  ORF Transcript_30211/g.42181 Transcript_30211/m.42181 type:complete len:148 (+) Transcript_30211:596-1039(+)